jgi:GH25 family lysozyme M1 (1,4-beta-N-acetylmuramidase)
MSFKYILRKGDRGQEVARLQAKVGADIDGIFGSKTEAEVIDYQSANDLGVDGLAGPKTLGHMGNEVYPGIDLSSHNGEVDFSKVVRAGVKYAWIKVTEGTTHVNPGFQKKFEDARKAGLIVGAYHFARPDTYAGDPKDWKNEADNFLKQLEVARLECGDLVPVVDLEQGLKTDDNYNCEWYLNWLDYVGCQTKTRPVIYTARWAWQLYIMKGSNELQNQLSTYPLWLASYNEGVQPERTTTLWNKWDIWQWTGSGTVPGVTGRCDQNWMAGGQLNKLRVP